MKKTLSRCLMLAGLLSIPIAVSNPECPDATAQYRNDPRLKSLRRFLQRFSCPARDLAAEFLRVADQHGLDWRLLPSISVVESGAGCMARNNNMFGWDGGKAIFVSARAGVHEMARSLATSRLYRNENVDGILRKYNPDANYPGVVKSVMRRISPYAKL